MKYGLPKEEKVKGSKTKWKLAMEQEITTLKFQISILKAQLEQNVNIINELRKGKISECPPAVRDWREKCNPLVANINNNNVRQHDFTLKVSAAFNSDRTISLETQVQPSITDLPPFGIHGFDGVGTRTEEYGMTFDLENEQSGFVPMNLKCITTMAQYRNWSLEELRFQDYVQERKLIVGTHPFRYLPIPIADTAVKNGVARPIICYNHCITIMPQYENKSFEELRLEDYTIKKQNIFSSQVRYKDIKSRLKRGLRRDDVLRKERNRPKFKPACGGCFTTGNVNAWTTKPAESELRMIDTGFWKPLLKTQPFESSQPVLNKDIKSTPWYSKPVFSTSTSRHEELLNRINTNFSVVNNHLSLVNSRLSQLTSQISVMDSRLSAVDMFVTMQRMKKTWLNLAPCLASLENNTSQPSSPVSMQPSENVPTSVHGNIDLSSSSSSFEITGTVHETKSFCDKESVNMNNSDLKNNNSMSESFSFKNTNMSSDSTCTSKNKMDVSESSLLNTSLTADVNHKTNSNENSLSKVNKSDLNINVSIASNTNAVRTEKSETEVRNGSDKAVQERESELSSLVSHDDDANVDPSIPEIPVKGTLIPPTIATEVKELKNDGSDSENDFEIIGKEEVVDNSTKEDVQCSRLSQSPSDESLHFKLCNDITEYMEVNLGKKKDTVYEFGFVAKPQLAVETAVETPTDDSRKEHQGSSMNTSGSFSKEDSFSSYVSHLLFEGQKQSTPKIAMTQDSKNDPEQKSPRNLGDTL